MFSAQSFIFVSLGRYQQGHQGRTKHCLKTQALQLVLDWLATKGRYPHLTDFVSVEPIYETLYLWLYCFG